MAIAIAFAALTVQAALARVDVKVDFDKTFNFKTVKTWSWISKPHPKHVLTQPFAWALIQIDGADTSLLHKVDAGSEANMKTGMKVKVRWADDRRGFITDIACFEPA